MFSVLSRKVILERGKWYHNSNSIGSNHLIRETLLGEDDIDISFFFKDCCNFESYFQWIYLHTGEWIVNRQWYQANQYFHLCHIQVPICPIILPYSWMFAVALLSNLQVSADRDSLLGRGNLKKSDLWKGLDSKPWNELFFPWESVFKLQVSIKVPSAENHELGLSKLK